MKFTCFKKDISKALNIVSKAVTTRTTMPILKGILLKVEDNTLTLTAYDLDILIETKISVTGYENGELVVKAKLFNEIIKKLPGEEVNISSDESIFVPPDQVIPESEEVNISNYENKVIIKSDKSEFKIHGQSADEFPSAGDVSEKESIILKSDDFIDMINKTSFAASLEESRGIIVGVLISLKQNFLTMVALDGFRVALNNRAVPNEKEKNIIVTAKILSEVASLLSEAENVSEISIVLDDRKAKINIDNTKVIIRLLEGEFISYESIIPENSKVKVTAGKDDLYNAIERASLLSREGKNNLVKFEIKDNSIVISSKSEAGNLIEEIFVDKEGEDLEIGFNAKYLSDALKAIDDESIILNFDSSVSPCSITPLVGSSFTHLVLPVRI